VIYEVQGNELVIEVICVGHRKDVYRWDAGTRKYLEMFEEARSNG
jgi:hypothetical protein